MRKELSSRLFLRAPQYVDPNVDHAGKDETLSAWLSQKKKKPAWVGAMYQIGFLRFLCFAGGQVPKKVEDKKKLRIKKS
jgi:hypothetical protein